MCVNPGVTLKRYPNTMFLDTHTKFIKNIWTIIWTEED